MYTKCDLISNILIDYSSNSSGSGSSISSSSSSSSISSSSSNGSRNGIGGDVSSSNGVGGRSSDSGCSISNDSCGRGNGISISSTLL